MQEDLLIFAIGCVCAAIGGELFFSGIIGVAERGRWPRGIVAATLGAFATSSPELIVAITSAWRNAPELALGAATGSNLTNIALILAVPLLFFGLQTTRGAVFRELPLALLIFPIIAIVAFDGHVTSQDAVLLLAVFVFWLALVVFAAARNRTEADGHRPSGRLYLGLILIVGLATLFLAGELIVDGASGLAVAFGVPNYIIGATVVAFGTSVPELATVVVSSLRRQPEVGLQTILGSNIFNCFFIIPVAALIHPIAVEWLSLKLTLEAGLIATLLIVPLGSWRLGRWRGLLLLALYAAFIALSLKPV
ncbi:MAG: sodium:calcium antiporter [Alphaproteobacteria bacterium]|nr:sodium:calcium antiporter [Alphaproteobacteria bacterium]